MRTANLLPFKLCNFTLRSYACPASSASVECVFSTYGMVQHQKQFGCREGRKNGFKHPDFIELKITSRIYSNCSNYSALFFKSFKFRCCSFCFDWKQITGTCTSVLPILLFMSYYIFQMKSRVGFFKWNLKKPDVFFGLRPITSTLAAGPSPLKPHINELTSKLAEY